VRVQGFAYIPSTINSEIKILWQIFKDHVMTYSFLTGYTSVWQECWWNLATLESTFMAIMEQRILKGVFAQKKRSCLSWITHAIGKSNFKYYKSRDTPNLSKYKELHSEVVSQFRSANTILCMCNVSQLETLNSFGNCSSCWMVMELQQFQSSTKRKLYN